MAEDQVMSATREFMLWVKKYLLPEGSTVEDVVRIWMDPITRDTANKLPFFKLRYYEETLKTMQYMINGSVPPGSSDYFSVYPFEVTRDGQHIILYLKAIQNMWSGTYLKSQTINFSQKARVVVYTENPLDTIKLRLLVYNTLMTPWLEMYATLLQDASRIAVAENSSIELYIPKAFSSSQLTRWDKLQCTIVDMIPGDKLQDITVLDVQMLIEQPPQITIINNHTGTQ
jgi:hypothetical protein